MLEVAKPIGIDILGLRLIGRKQVGDEVSFRGFRILKHILKGGQETSNLG